MADTTNVLAFTRPKQARIRYCDVHLHDDFSIELRLFDWNGNLIETLECGSVSKPAVIDLDELRAVWDAWALASANITHDTSA